MQTLQVSCTILDSKMSGLMGSGLNLGEWLRRNQERGRKQDFLALRAGEVGQLWVPGACGGGDDLASVLGVPGQWLP